MLERLRLKCGGNINISSANFNAGTSTFYHRNGARTLSLTQPLYNYTVGGGAPEGSSSVAVTLLSDLTVQNNFTILYDAGYTRSLSAGTHTIYVGGNWANGDTFTAGSSTVIFNGTGTQNISTTTLATGAFNNLTINKASGSATLTDNNTTVGGNLNVSLGTLAIGTYNLAVTGTSTVTGSGGTAYVTIGISGGTGWTTTGNFTIGASGTVTCSGNSLLTVGGSWDSSAGAFTYGTSTVTFTAVGTGNTIKSGSIDSYTFYNVIWNSVNGNDWTLQMILHRQWHYHYD